MSKPHRPPRVKDIQEYWVNPPPEPSLALTHWLQQLDAGWRPNKRIRTMGYHEKAEFFGVFLWEHLNVLSPRLLALEPAS